jgi:serine/threonine-protein kinase
MEYVSGTAMDRLIAEHGGVPAAAALGVGVLVCRGLHYAHNASVTIYGQTYRGIVHRDLKPANILLSSTGRVKLTDFGIARPGTVSLHTTELGSIVGTLPYLAPEQIDSGSVTPRTDVYALGTTLYELLTGSKAYPQQDVTALVSAKSQGRRPPLMPGAELPRRVIDIVNKAMSVDPSERHAGAGELGADLENALRGIVKRKPYAYLTELLAPDPDEQPRKS